MPRVGRALRDHLRVMHEPRHVPTEAEEEQRGREQGATMRRAMVRNELAIDVMVTTYSDMATNEADPLRRAFARGALEGLKVKA